MKTSYLEQKVVNYFDFRRNCIVPNVSWGFDLRYEADLMVMTKDGYLTEVELKVSKSDLKADLNKRIFHNSKRTKYLCFAFPEDLLETALQLLPEEVGLLCLMKDKNYNSGYGYIKCIRRPKKRSDYRLTPEEQIKLLRLGVMRVWSGGRSTVDYDQHFEPKNQVTLLDLIDSVTQQKEIESEVIENCLDWFNQ